MTNVHASFAFLPLVLFPVSLCFLDCVLIARLQPQQWRCLSVLQRQSESQHVANPNRGMQCTTVGLAGIRNPKPITAPTVTRKVRYWKKYAQKGEDDERSCSLTHSLLLWAVMSGFGELINTKHTVWLRAVEIDYFANCSCAVSICPIR